MQQIQTLPPFLRHIGGGKNKKDWKKESKEKTEIYSTFNISYKRHTNSKEIGKVYNNFLQFFLLNKS